MKLFWWLLPGLRLKRYVFEIIVGLVLLAAAGLFFALWLTGDTAPIEGEVNAAQSALYLAAAAFVLSVVLLYFGILGLARSIIRILRSAGGAGGPFRDLVLAAARRESGPRVVAFGGGTGLKSLLKGLKEHTGRISAVITMADDGGSSGRLRMELGALPPGDIRNCLVALSNVGPTLEKLFQFRFQEGELEGHSFGNLFITSLHAICGDFREAVRLAGEVLAIAGEVLPSTTDKVGLVARHEDGSVTTGQANIQRTGKRIAKVELRPRPSQVHPDIKAALSEAALVVFGPGSLYTSVIPNLLVPGMVEAVRASYGLKVYVCNILTQIGETDDYDAVDHIRAIEEHAGGRIFDVVVVNSARRELPPFRKGQRFVEYDAEAIRRMGYRVVEADLLGPDFLHDPAAVASVLVDLVNQRVREETTAI